MCIYSRFYLLLTISKVNVSDVKLFHEEKLWFLWLKKLRNNYEGAGYDHKSDFDHDQRHCREDIRIWYLFVILYCRKRSWFVCWPVSCPVGSFSVAYSVGISSGTLCIVLLSHFNLTASRTFMDKSWVHVFHSNHWLVSGHLGFNTFWCSYSEFHFCFKTIVDGTGGNCHHPFAMVNHALVQLHLVAIKRWDWSI